MYTRSLARDNIYRNGEKLKRVSAEEINIQVEAKDSAVLFAARFKGVLAARWLYRTFGYTTFGG